MGDLICHGISTETFWSSYFCFESVCARFIRRPMIFNCDSMSLREERCRVSHIRGTLVAYLKSSVTPRLFSLCSSPSSRNRHYFVITMRKSPGECYHFCETEFPLLICSLRRASCYGMSIVGNHLLQHFCYLSEGLA